MSYSPPNTSLGKLFAATGSTIHDVTVKGSPTSAVTLLSNGRWQHVNVSTIAGNYLLCVNGADAMRQFDGTSWTTPAITVDSLAYDTAQWSNLAWHKNRLWAVKENSLDLYYLQVASIAGPATRFPIATQALKGGRIVSVGSWSVDGGAGLDDLLVVVLSTGHVAIYNGDNPASNMFLVGTYKIPEPLGERGLVKAGADLAILTEAGPVLLSQVLSSSETTQRAKTLSGPIQPSFIEEHGSNAASFGWEAVEYPNEQLVIVNVPIAELVTSHQYVLNTAEARAPAWCRWTGLNAVCWAMHAGHMYFGDVSGRVCHYGGETTDNGELITATWLTAFSTFKRATQKLVKRVRAVIKGPVGYFPTVVSRTDYDDAPLSISSTIALNPPQAVWDVALWDVGLWQGDAVPVARWQACHGSGLALAFGMALSLDSAFEVSQLDVMYEEGDPV